MPFKIIIKILIPCFIIIAGAFGVWFFFSAQKADDNMSGSVSPSSSAQTNEYENTQYGFTFNYLDGFNINEFAEEEGKTVLTIQNAKAGQSLQIYITTYDDPSFAASKERVLRDVPDLPFSNPADVVVGGKAKGVAFFSQNEAFGGATAEVWFADGKNFYQATARAGDAKMLEEIIKSWKFQE